MMGWDKKRTIGIYVWLRNCLAYLEKKRVNDADANANNVTKGGGCWHKKVLTASFLNSFWHFHENDDQHLHK